MQEIEGKKHDGDYTYNSYFSNATHALKGKANPWLFTFRKIWTKIYGY